MGAGVRPKEWESAQEMTPKWGGMQVPKLAKSLLYSFISHANLSKYPKLSGLSSPIYKMGDPIPGQLTSCWKVWGEKPQTLFLFKHPSPFFSVLARFLSSSLPSWLDPSSLVLWAHYSWFLSNGDLKGSMCKGVAGIMEDGGLPKRAELDFCRCPIQSHLVFSHRLDMRAIKKH